ncbi:Polysaccharide deacetylase [compost metagenome]
MMSKRIRLDLFPGGVRKVLTMSYDDGKEADRRLVEIFNHNGIRGTFNLNSGLLGIGDRIPSDQVDQLYKGHEVAVHTVHHPSLLFVPTEELSPEILGDRIALESLVGYPVRGMAYPNGYYDSKLSATLPTFGIEYARTVESHGQFKLPTSLLEWHPTCHHNHNLLEIGERFATLSKTNAPFLLYVWGHSYEFDQDHNWHVIEQFCEQLSKRDDIWYATNIEIVSYIKALQRLVFSGDCSMVYNPTALRLWFSVGDSMVEIEPGETKRLEEA